MCHAATYIHTCTCNLTTIVRCSNTDAHQTTTASVPVNIPCPAHGGPDEGSFITRIGLSRENAERVKLYIHNRRIKQGDTVIDLLNRISQLIYSARTWIRGSQENSREKQAEAYESLGFIKLQRAPPVPPKIPLDKDDEKEYALSTADTLISEIGSSATLETDPYWPNASPQQQQQQQQHHDPYQHNNPHQYQHHQHQHHNSHQQHSPHQYHQHQPLRHQNPEAQNPQAQKNTNLNPTPQQAPRHHPQSVIPNNFHITRRPVGANYRHTPIQVDERIILANTKANGRVLAAIHKAECISAEEQSQRLLAQLEQQVENLRHPLDAELWRRSVAILPTIPFFGRKSGSE